MPMLQKSPAKPTLKIKAPAQKPAAKESKYITYKNLDRGAEIALYYGFSPESTPEIKKSDLDNARSLFDCDFIEEGEEGNPSVLPLHAEEKVAILRTYTEKNMIALPQPVMLYFKGSFRGSVSKKGSVYPRYCDLEILGSSKSIAEAILIKTALTILAEEDYKEICVEINSIGDKESLARFARDLTNYYRKNLNTICSACRQALKKDVFELLSCKNQKCHDIKENAPKSMNFLSEASRQHFREVLEYLEKLDIPYRINDHLMGNRKYCSETIFELVNTCEQKKDNEHRTLAIGVRYDGLAKRIGLKKEIPGAGISLLIKNTHKTPEKKKIQKLKKPAVYFIQLSFDAKLQSLRVIETLRQAKIPVYQSLGKDKLIGQISVAEKMRTPYMILMGKKEAMEDSVIVRDMNTRSQDTVKISDLSHYLKKLKF
jgi:histidyl-tRNA synthetase